MFTRFQNLALLDNKPADWLLAAAIAIVSWALLSLVVRWATHSLRDAAKKTLNRVDDVAVHVAAATKRPLLLVFAVYCGSLALKLEPSTRGFLDSVAMIALFAQAAFWSIALLDALIGLQRLANAKDPSKLPSLAALTFLGRLALIALFTLLALDNLGVQITTLLAGLGITSIAVALALQTVLGDLFASLSIVLDKPFEIGDSITVGEFQGTVENIGLRTTRLRSVSGEQLVLGNHDLLASRIRNFKRMADRRAVFTFSVEPGTPVDLVEMIPTLVREAIEAQPHTRFDRSHFKSLGGESLLFETVYFMRVPDFGIYMDTQQAVNLQLYRRFAELGIRLAFPSQRLVVEGQLPVGAPSHASETPQEGSGAGSGSP